MDNTVTINELFAFCELIFPENIHISRDFIEYLRPAGLKSAFREKIKENHPDKAIAQGTCPEVLSERFVRIREAYENLLPFVTGEKKLQGAGPGPSGHNRVRTAAKTPGARPAEKFDFFHSGPIPNIKLRFSLYLYYRGRISWKQCMQSLVWQRKQRPLMGKLASEWNFLRDSDINAILRAAHPGELFGESALRLAKLTPYQVNVLLGKQCFYKAKVGRYFVQERLISEDELTQILKDFYKHNCTCGGNRN